MPDFKCCGLVGTLKMRYPCHVGSIAENNLACVNWQNNCAADITEQVGINGRLLLRHFIASVFFVNAALRKKSPGPYEGVTSNRKVDHVRMDNKWLSFPTYSSSFQEANHKKHVT